MRPALVTSISLALAAGACATIVGLDGSDADSQATNASSSSGDTSSGNTSGNSASTSGSASASDAQQPSSSTGSTSTSSGSSSSASSSSSGQPKDAAPDVVTTNQGCDKNPDCDDEPFAKKCGQNGKCTSLCINREETCLGGVGDDQCCFGSECKFTGAGTTLHQCKKRP